MCNRQPLKNVSDWTKPQKLNNTKIFHANYFQHENFPTYGMYATQILHTTCSRSPHNVPHLPCIVIYGMSHYITVVDVCARVRLTSFCKTVGKGGSKYCNGGTFYFICYIKIHSWTYGTQNEHTPGKFHWSWISPSYMLVWYLVSKLESNLIAIFGKL